MNTPIEHFHRYVQAKGGPKAAAVALGIIKAVTVRAILSGRRAISPAVARAVHADTGGLITREQLCPGTYGAVIPQKAA